MCTALLILMGTEGYVSFSVVGVFKGQYSALGDCGQLY